MKKKIVVVGGGNGSAVSIVALKQHLELFDLSAVVSMSDSGGSSGRLRRELGVLPPGDIMRVVLAMSKYDYVILKKVFFRERFTGAGKLDGHNLGNIFVSLAGQYAGNIIDAIKALGQSIETVGTVYPVMTEQADLVAELENGQIVRTEAEIDKPKYDLSIPIKKVWLEPQPEIYPEAEKTLLGADYIVFGPGSLFTSVIATTLAKGFKEAVEKSHAKLIFVTGNAYIQGAETCPHTLSGTVLALEKYLPRRLDAVLFNGQKLNDKQMELYSAKKWILLEDDKENLSGVKVIRDGYEKAVGGLCALQLGEIFSKVLI